MSSALLAQMRQDNPLFLFPQDDASGTLKDRSGNSGRDAYRLYGTRTYQQAGPAGMKGVRYNIGAVQNDALAALTLGKVDFTFEVWAKWTISTFGTLCAWRWNAADSLSIQGIITVNRLGAGDVSAETWAWSDDATKVRYGSTLNDGQSRHIVAVYTQSDNDLRLYVEGELQDTRDQGAASPNTSVSYNITVGSNGDGYSSIQGIDTTQVFCAGYATALSADRVKAHYLAGIRSGTVMG